VFCLSSYASVILIPCYTKNIVLQFLVFIIKYLFFFKDWCYEDSDDNSENSNKICSTFCMRYFVI
jgi:hypothetical protein